MLLLAVLVSVAIACDGPCVRFLSSDFDLRLAFPSHIISPDVYNGAGGISTPFQTVLDRLIELADFEPRVETDPERFRPTDWLVGDATRIRTVTGWRPSIPLDSILRELYEDWSKRDVE